MFTGIITDIGTISTVEQRGDLRLVIACHYDMTGVAIGASIACSGACLTVVAKGEGSFAVDVSAETVARTAPGRWVAGGRLNLERALKVGDELGGHIVTGHVDGLARVLDIRGEGDSRRVELAVPRALGAQIAPKGSITLDGVSLTVNDVEDAGEETRFAINLIPHTWEMTTLGALASGAMVNVEIDILARYLARMTAAHAA